MTDVHEHIEFTCRGEDDAPPCGGTVSYPEHYLTIRRPSHPDYQHMEKALVFECPRCKKKHYRCPVCTDEDNTPAGWFRGESTGKQLACHNCNEREYIRQQRSPY